MIRFQSGVCQQYFLILPTTTPFLLPRLLWHQGFRHTGYTFLLTVMPKVHRLRQCCTLLVVAQWASRSISQQCATFFSKTIFFSVFVEFCILFSVFDIPRPKPYINGRKKRKKSSKVGIEPRPFNCESSVLPVAPSRAKFLSRRLNMGTSGSGFSGPVDRYAPIFEPDLGTNLLLVSSKIWRRSIQIRKLMERCDTKKNTVEGIIAHSQEYAPVTLSVEEKTYS